LEILLAPRLMTTLLCSYRVYPACVYVSSNRTFYELPWRPWAPQYPVYGLLLSNCKKVLYQV